MSNSAGSPSSNSLGNRRAFRRAELKAPVLIDASSTYHTGRCRDVSPAGIGVETDAPFVPGTVVDLYFELPTGSAIEARAEVARCANHAVGLKFHDLSAEAGDALRSYCEGWRRALLQRCATRTPSMSDATSTHGAAPTRVCGPDSSTAFQRPEPSSAVRVRVAPILSVTAERKR